MNGVILEKIYNARVQLRDRGERDTQDAVLEIVGGSKSTVVKYWQASNPATYTPTGLRETSSPVNGDAPPVADNEAVFEETFAAYLDAAIKFGAVSGLRVRYTYPPQHGRRAPELTRDYDVSPRHPKYQQLEEALATAHRAHLAAWAVLEDRVDAARPVREPEPEPPPAPEPELSIENLRAYYVNRSTSPWPGGIPRALPIEVYPALQQLWKETNDAIGKADRARYDVRNALSSQGVRDLDHHPELREVENRRSTTRLMLHSIQSDMENVRMRAHREGIELKDPRLS